MTMNLRRAAAMFGMMLIGMALAHAMGSAVQPAAASSEAAKDDEQKATERYVQAQLRLAELTFKRAEEFNRKVPRTLSMAVMEQFKDNVDVAKLQLENVIRTRTIDAYQDLVARAELEVRAAEAKLKAGQHSNQVSPGSVSEADMERLKLSAEVVRYRMERGRLLAKASTSEKLQWELEMLSANMNKIQSLLLLISQNRISEF
jgi:hypothetical protein